MNISVIIPCYNLGNYVSQAIESALGQTRLPDEIIVIDDASSDNSADVIDSFNNNPLVTILKNDTNLGLIETFNKAIKTSKSSHFVLLSADDWMESNFLEIHLEKANEIPDCAMYYCDFVVFGSRARKFAEKNGLTFNNGECVLHFPDATPEALSNIANRNMLHGTSLCSREWYDKVGGYRASDLPEDLDFGIRILEAGATVAHVDAPLLHYRQHSIAQTQSQRLHLEEIDDYQGQLDRLRASEIHLNASVDERDREIEKLKKGSEFSEIFIRALGFDSIEHACQQDRDRPLRYRLFLFSRFFTEKALRTYDYLARRPKNTH